eukprot:6464925-Pyramimonas_sp.AAC.1
MAHSLQCCVLDVGLARGLVALTVALLNFVVCLSPGVRSLGRGLTRVRAARWLRERVSGAPFVGDGAMRA